MIDRLFGDQSNLQADFFLVSRHLASEIDYMYDELITCQVPSPITEQSLFLSNLEHPGLVGPRHPEVLSGYHPENRPGCIWQNFCYFGSDLWFASCLAGWLVGCLPNCLV